MDNLMDAVDVEIPGSVVKGQLYRERNPSQSKSYLLGDVLQVDLLTGYTVDVGWEPTGDERNPFLIVVFRDYWDEQHASRRAATADEVAFVVKQLAGQFSETAVSVKAESG